MRPRRALSTAAARLPLSRLTTRQPPALHTHKSWANRRLTDNGFRFLLDSRM